MITNQQVAVIGSLNYDLLIKQERLPKKGETFTADELIQGSGGKGANQAAQCAKLGLSTSLIGKVGEDRFGEALTGSLQAFGVNVDYVGKKGTTGMGIVNVLPDGDYHSTLLRGANYLITKEDIDESLEVITNCQYVLLQQEIPLSIIEYIIEKTRGAACKLVLNNAPARDMNETKLAAINILVVNETEAEFMSGCKVDSIESAHEVAQKLVKKVKDTVILTLGALGVVVATKYGSIYTPAKKVVAVDATGAGDSFIGAFVYCLIEGYTLQKATDFATSVSSITVSRVGGSESFPTLNEVKGLTNKPIGI
ncbi:ribokinase [Metabacillus halosaccharovorans]|uniref:ribokinase n=1 Tax=Metabacillus halosaccharovorans TaxID=930124 RepID=UPI00203FBAB0|nr:ribokinase [Metabacillus halosaccharovorans]MCM3439781.1 ribokinase [Metabacillus halosaccharovorans]